MIFWNTPFKNYPLITDILKKTPTEETLLLQFLSLHPKKDNEETVNKIPQ